MSYSDAIADLTLIRSQGWYGVQLAGNALNPVSAPSQFVLFIEPTVNPEIKSWGEKRVTVINSINKTLSPDHPGPTLELFRKSMNFFHDWNAFVEAPNLKIDVRLVTVSQFFPSTDFCCFYETPEFMPLIVEPTISSCDLTVWGEGHQQVVKEAMVQHGAIVFRNFKITQDSFSQVFTALTGKKPTPYKGDTPRETIGENIYHSTAVAQEHTIPLHQELSMIRREDMADYISFFCVTPPKRRTGQTLLGDAKVVTDYLKDLQPALWTQLCQNKINYIANYLPSNTTKTSMIQAVNPSHADVIKQFGTEDPQKISQMCSEQGMSCILRDSGGVTVIRQNIPSTIEIDGLTLFCNQIYLNKLSPQLCGGELKYQAASWIYSDSETRQFDAEFSDQTPISQDMIAHMFAALERAVIRRDWNQGELLLIRNKRIMHGKLPHEGSRKIIVALA